MKKILIIEDEAIIAMAYKKMLEQLGYKIIAIVPTGAKAIEQVIDHSPDLIISAVFLSSGINGIQAIKAIRIFSNVPVIFLSGSSDPEIRKEASSISKVVDFISKPTDILILKDAIARALNTVEFSTVTV